MMNYRRYEENKTNANYEVSDKVHSVNKEINITMFNLAHVKIITHIYINRF